MPAAVQGDAADLHHATMNLLLNAVRFTPDGGAIDVSVTDDGERVRIAVRDDGVGIPTELHRRIGEPFFTAAVVDHHHSDRIAFGAGGIGLGLAVARAVAADHGGRLRFESAPGRGSTFAIELACARADGDAAGP